MAIEAWGKDPPLIHRLVEKGHFFSFFQAVYLLERYAGSFGKIARVGEQGPAELESLRLRPSASLAFPISDIVSIEKIDSGEDRPPRFQLTTSFLGLYGPNSPLPDFYTEDIIRTDSEGSDVREFLDIFHHRLLSLFYRCWLKYRYHIQFAPGGTDEFSQRMFALMGIGTPGLIQEVHVPAVRLLRYVGLIAQQSRSATALESFLSDYFGGIPIHIEQCVGRWVTIKEEDRFLLGVRNNRLGIETVIGEQVFDRSSKFRISIRLAKFAEFVKFLPDGEHFRSLIELVQIFLHDPLRFEEELILPGGEVPMLSLSSESGSRLGRTTWLISRQPDNSVSVIFQSIERGLP